MMGKYKPILLLGGAVVIALITSIMAYNWLREKSAVQKEAAVLSQPVAVAVADLSRGTVLSKEMIKMVSYLKESLPEGSFSDASSLEGRVLLFPIQGNEPIFESRLAPNTVKTGGVAVLVNPEKRAMAVKVDKFIGVSGFINPGNQVDVLVTIDKPDERSAPVTKIVLQNVVVLATGSELEKKGKDDKPTKVDVITLEVTPEEAEKLALAATEGRIQLALRNFADTKDVLTKGATKSALLASYNSVEKVRKIIRAKNPGHTVEMIKGSEVSTVKVKGG